MSLRVLLLMVAFTSCLIAGIDVFSGLQTCPKTSLQGAPVFTLWLKVRNQSEQPPGGRTVSHSLGLNSGEFRQTPALQSSHWSTLSSTEGLCRQWSRAHSWPGGWPWRPRQDPQLHVILTKRLRAPMNLSFSEWIRCQGVGLKNFHILNNISR